MSCGKEWKEIKRRYYNPNVVCFGYNLLLGKQNSAKEND